MVEFQIEKISAVFEEIQNLLAIHCREVVSFMSVDTIDFGLYDTLEQAEALHIITARDQGKLVGYAIYLLAPDTHTSQFTATSDAFFMMPDKRGWDGLRLMKYAEKTLQAKGVQQIVNTFPIREDNRGYTAFMRCLGYKMSSVQYIKKMEK